MKTGPLSFITPQRIPALAFAVSGGLLLGAYAFQYIGGLAPCQMCYWQRYVHFAVLAISALAMIANGISRQKTARLFTVLIALVFLVSAGMGLWHMGVEYKWWDGPKSCMATPGGGINPSDILSALDGKAKMPSCTDAPWHLFGLSMAAYNMLISALGAGLSLMALHKGASNV